MMVLLCLGRLYGKAGPLVRYSDDSSARPWQPHIQQIKRVEPKFHLARHVKSRHAARSTCRPMHFCCVELVEQHGSIRSSRRARHVERVVSRRDVTWRANWHKTRRQLCRMRRRSVANRGCGRCDPVGKWRHDDVTGSHDLRARERVGHARLWVPRASVQPLRQPRRLAEDTARRAHSNKHHEQHRRAVLKHRPPLGVVQRMM